MGSKYLKQKKSVVKKFLLYFFWWKEICSEKYSVIKKGNETNLGIKLNFVIKTQKLKSQIMIKPKSQICTTFKNSNWCKIQRLKLWRKKLATLSSDKTEKSNWDKLKKSSPEKTKFLTKSLQARRTGHLNNGRDLLGAAFCDLAILFCYQRRVPLPNVFNA